MSTVDIAKEVISKEIYELEQLKSRIGKDFEKAKYYPEDKNYLTHFPESVIHYEVFAE